VQVKFPTSCYISLDFVIYSFHPQASAHRGSSSLDELVYHSVPFCFSIIPDASCTLYRPSYIISTDSYTLIPNTCALNGTESDCQDRSMLSGHSAGLNFFFGVQPQMARLSLNYGPLIHGSKPDSGEVVQLTWPREPDQQIFFSFPSSAREQNTVRYTICNVQ